MNKPYILLLVLLWTLPLLATPYAGEIFRLAPGVQNQAMGSTGLSYTGSLAAGWWNPALLAGDPDPGNPAAVPEATVRGWVDEGVLQWLGHVDDMPALFRSVDVVVLPSYREGLPKGLIEAGASGCALVTTDVPGCREVVTDGVDGLRIPPRDAAALAHAIARLHDDPVLRARLAEAARRKAEELFDERIVIARTIEVYRELQVA